MAMAVLNGATVVQNSKEELEPSRTRRLDLRDTCCLECRLSSETEMKETVLRESRIIDLVIIRYH